MDQTNEGSCSNWMMMLSTEFLSTREESTTKFFFFFCFPASLYSPLGCCYRGRKIEKGERVSIDADIPADRLERFKGKVKTRR